MTQRCIIQTGVQAPPIAQLLGLSLGRIKTKCAAAGYHTRLVKSLKSETSKMIQIEFESEFNAVYYKTALWGRQKFIVSCGGAPLKIVQEYIKNQASPQH